MKKLQPLLATLCLGLLSSGVGAQTPSPETKAFSGYGLGVTSGQSAGIHTIGVEVLGYGGSLASSGLNGPSAGVTFQYLGSWDKWRFGPRLHSEKINFTAGDRIGNPYVSLDTSLKLSEMHSLSFVVGRVVNKWMPYAFLGVAVSNGTIGAQLNVLDQSAKVSSSGFVAGPILGLGLEYQIERNFYLGIEMSQARLVNKTYQHCIVELGGCVDFPVKIEPMMVNVTFTKRF